MTENIKTAMIAINKWFFYGYNYDCVEMEIATFSGVEKMYAPSCLQAFPVGMRKHFLGKWNELYDAYGSRAVLMAFYAELSPSNRKLLIEWIMGNYNNEQKLSFNEE